MGILRFVENSLVTAACAWDDYKKSQKRISELHVHLLPNNPAVTIDEVCALNDKYRKIVFDSHIPLFQMKPYTEEELMVEASKIWEQMFNDVTAEINDEIKRLGKLNDYEKHIAKNDNFSALLSFWNENIPNLKLFLENSFEKTVSRMARKVTNKIL